MGAEAFGAYRRTDGQTWGDNSRFKEFWEMRVKTGVFNVYLNFERGKGLDTNICNPLRCRQRGITKAIR